MNHTDYYVYAHRDLNGVVFYIGKGRLKRAYTNNGRSSAWKEKTKEGYTVEILYSNLTAEQAHAREKESIERPESDWSLLNKRLPSKTKPLEQKNYWTYWSMMKLVRHYLDGKLTDFQGRI